MFACLGDVGLVLGLDLLEGEFKTLGLVLVLVPGVARGGEESGEPFVLGFEPEGVCLRVGELCAEFLEGDFEVPVFLFELVCVRVGRSTCDRRTKNERDGRTCALFLLTQSGPELVDRLVHVVFFFLHVLYSLVALGEETLESSDFREKPAADLERKLWKRAR